jgi:hypothetical protein
MPKSNQSTKIWDQSEKPKKKHTITKALPPDRLHTVTSVVDKVGIFQQMKLTFIFERPIIAPNDTYIRGESCMSENVEYHSFYCRKSGKILPNNHWIQKAIIEPTIRFVLA